MFAMALHPDWCNRRALPALKAWRKLLIGALTAGAFLMTVEADDAFLRIEAVTVSASDHNHDSWINLLAFGDGSVRGPLAPLSAGGGTATPP